MKVAAIFLFVVVAFSYASPTHLIETDIRDGAFEDNQISVGGKHLVIESRFPIFFPPTYQHLRVGSIWTGPIWPINPNRGPFIYRRSTRVYNFVWIADRRGRLYRLRVNPFKLPSITDKPIFKLVTKGHEESVKEKPIQEEPVKEELVQEEPVQEKPDKKELAQEKPIKEEPVKEKPGKEEPVQEQAVQVEPVEEKPPVEE